MKRTRCGDPHPTKAYASCGRYKGHKGHHREMSSAECWTSALHAEDRAVTPHERLLQQAVDTPPLDTTDPHAVRDWAKRLAADSVAAGEQESRAVTAPQEPEPCQTCKLWEREAKEANQRQAEMHREWEETVDELAALTHAIEALRGEMEQEVERLCSFNCDAESSCNCVAHQFYRLVNDRTNQGRTTT